MKASGLFRLQKKEQDKLSKGGQLPWKYLWIVDISALSYQRAFSVDSALEKTMQTMHLEDWFPHECHSYCVYCKQDKEIHLSGGYRCGCLSALLIGSPTDDQSRHALYISNQLLSNGQVFQVVSFSVFCSVLLHRVHECLLRFFFFFAVKMYFGKLLKAANTFPSTTEN